MAFKTVLMVVRVPDELAERDVVSLEADLCETMTRWNTRDGREHLAEVQFATISDGFSDAAIAAGAEPVDEVDDDVPLLSRPEVLAEDARELATEQVQHAILAGRARARGRIVVDGEMIALMRPEPDA